MAARRRRLDVELVRRGLAGSRTEAQEAIAAGVVTVDGAPALKASSQVLPSASLALTRVTREFVSRGGGKLAHALDTFDVDVTGLRCLDAGISTGGFTDCLLQRGAVHVVGVDVGYGQVAEAVRTDARVDVRERTNVRDLTPDDVDPVDLVVCDVSFIALRTVLPTLVTLLREDGRVVALVKPQFEAGREDVGSGGVVRDPAVWERVLREVVADAAGLGWPVRAVAVSPLPGPAGNVEFLVDVGRTTTGLVEPVLTAVLDATLDEARALATSVGVTLVGDPDEPDAP